MVKSRCFASARDFQNLDFPESIFSIFWPLKTTILHRNKPIENGNDINKNRIYVNIIDILYVRLYLEQYEIDINVRLSSEEILLKWLCYSLIFG